MNDTVVKCNNCDVPLVFYYVLRTDTQTRGFYHCPKCDKGLLK
jgi:DNA-directed RNA polymerase subunit M/transcription elongation factor TFIIS